MGKDYKFQKGDRVQVVSECQSYGKQGVVVRYVNYPIWYTCNYVEVKLSSGGRRTYNESSLKLINTNQENNITDKGDNEMITGNYRVAMVKFIQGTNTDKKYAFALFNDELEVDDCVLCDTRNGYSVGKIVEIISKDEYNGVEITKEIMCYVDFSDFEQRKKNRAEAKKLKSEMDKKMKEMQELALYEMMAEKSPELKEMLDNYKALMA